MHDLCNVHTFVSVSKLTQPTSVCVMSQPRPLAVALRRVTVSWHLTQIASSYSKIQKPNTIVFQAKLKIIIIIIILAAIVLGAINSDHE
jgi:sugar diacid utilization regulator